MADDLTNQLMNAKGFCTNCGTQLTFEESARLAKSQGVSEKAVMCPNCKKVFNVNITPEKMTVLDEIKKYNFSNDVNSQASPQNVQNSYIPEGFQKKVDRDKKIIYGAIIVVAILIVLSIVLIPFSEPSYDYDDSYDIDYNNLVDISASSNEKVKLTDVHTDDAGWCFVYGKISPKGTNDGSYHSLVTYYDKKGVEIASDHMAIDSGDGEVMLGGADLGKDKVDHIDVKIIDDTNSIVAKTTYRK